MARSTLNYAATVAQAATRRYRILNLVALLVLLAGFAVAFFQVHQYENGITRENFVIHGALPVPVIHLRPTHRQGAAIVIIVHGFSASKEIMLSIGVELGRMGVPSYLLDLPGHAEASVPLANGSDDAAAAQYQADLDTVVQYARANSDVPQPQIILVGHSIGTIIVSDYSFRRPAGEIAATILLSPSTVLRPTTDAPANLLLIVEQNDYFGYLIQRAHDLTSLGCGTPIAASATYYRCGNPAAGTGRELLVAPGSNHITIITDPTTLQAVDDWVAATAGIPSPRVQSDTRLHWTEVGVLCAFLALFPLLCLLVSLFGLRPVADEAATPAVRTSPNLAFWARIGIYAPVVALTTLILFGWSVIADAHNAHNWRTPLAWTGMILADYSIAYLLVAGVIGSALFAILQRGWPWQIGPKPWRQLAIGVIGFAMLYATVGTLTTFAWERFLLTGARSWRFALFAVVALPLFVLMESVFADAASWRLLLGRLGVLFLISLGLLGGILLDPTSLGFLGLLLPIEILLFVALSLVLVWLRRQGRETSLAGAVVAALVFGWVIAAVFPIIA